MTAAAPLERDLDRELAEELVREADKGRSLREWFRTFGARVFETNDAGELVVDANGEPLPRPELLAFLNHDRSASVYPFEHPIVREWRSGRAGTVELWKALVLQAIRVVHPDNGEVRDFFRDAWIEEGCGQRCTDPRCELRERLERKARDERLSAIERRRFARMAAAAGGCTHEITGKKRVRVKARDQWAALAALARRADFTRWTVGRFVAIDMGDEAKVPELAAEAALQLRAFERTLRVLRGREAWNADGSRHHFGNVMDQLSMLEVLSQWNQRFGRAASVYIIFLAPILGAALGILAKRAISHRWSAPAPAPKKGAPASAKPAASAPPRDPDPDRAPPVVDEQRWSLIVETIAERRGQPVSGVMESDAARAAVVAAVGKVFDVLGASNIEDAHLKAIRLFDEAYQSLDRPYLRSNGWPLRCLYRVDRDRRVVAYDLDESLAKALRSARKLVERAKRAPTAAGGERADEHPPNCGGCVLCRRTRASALVIGDSILRAGLAPPEGGCLASPRR